jgi:hypothetical protein
MKNLFTHAVSKAFSALIMLAFFPVLVSSQIVSAPGGGLWNSTSTWIGGTIPTAATDVIIASNVLVNGGSCRNLQVNAGALLQNNNASSYNLFVNGNVLNNGTISNGSSFGLILYLTGNLTNNGTMSNNTITLNGTTNQQISSTQVMSVGTFSKNVGNGRALALTNLSFSGTTLSLNTDTLEFTGGSELTMDGGYITNGVIYKSSLPALKLTAGNGTYATSVTVTSPQTEFYGTIQFFGSSNYFRDNFINYGILENYPSTTYTLNIAGNITNNGTIRNNTNYSLNLNITGNITNNGTWDNNNTILSGNNQDFSMTQPVSCTQLQRFTGPGRVRATSTLSFEGTEVILSGDTLEFTSGSALIMNGGYLYNGVVLKQALPALVLNISNGNYFQSVTVNAVEASLEGSFLFYSINRFIGNVINNGTVRNYQISSYTLTVTGNFTNNGTVTSNVYDFNMNISGNLTNNGVWTNETTTLNGTANQQISMSQPFAGKSVSRTAGAGRLIAVTDLTFNNTQVSLNNDTLQFTTGTGITMNGGYLNPGVLFKTSQPAIKLTGSNGFYFYNLSVDAPQTETYGTISVYGSTNNFKTLLVNYGTLQNRGISSYSLVVNGGITNEGTIQNNVYDFSISLSGDLTNNGIWKNRTTTLTGNSAHTFSFSERFEGETFVNSNAAGAINAITDLFFDGTGIDLNNGAINLPSGGSLTVNNGYLLEAVVGGSGVHFRSLGSYCHAVSFTSDQTYLHGVFQASTGVSFSGNVVNEGTMRNRGISSYSAVVQGDLENNGEIINPVYSFTLTVLGDITNNGIWSNTLTLLDGTTDQFVYLVNSQPITGEVRFDANFSGAGFVWYGPGGSLVGNPSFSGATSQTLRFLVPVTDAFAGQYYCRNNQAVNSRNIFIQALSNPVRPLTLNFLLEGLYNAGGQMNPSLDASGNPVWNSSVTDQISVDLHDASDFSNILFSKDEVLLSTTGVVSLNVPAAYTASYYISIRHRSGIVTVSAAPVPFNTPTVSYSFNTPSAAYGSNMMQTGDGFTAFFSGDVNQDGVIDTADMTPVDNGSADYLGGYRNPDVNGDGIIDTADMTLVDNNSNNYISAATP